MLCFKFHQNRTTNEEFDFWGGVKGEGVPQFQKLEKISRGICQLNIPIKFQQDRIISESVR